MSARIVTLDATVHKAAQELLPWFVTDTLEGEQLSMVQEHIRNCAQCQADIAWQRKFQSVYLPSDAAPDVDKAFAQLLAKLPAQPQAPKRNLLAIVRSLFSSENVQWMRWGLAAQCAIIVGLLFQVASPVADHSAYHVLGTPKETGGNLVVMFRPEVKEQDLRRILHASNARLVDGPTVSDAYLLSVPEASVAQALVQLRAEPAVALAEPLDSGSGR